MAAVGNLNQDIVRRVKDIFEQRCIELLGMACEKLKTCKSVNEDWGEENISANIYANIHGSQKAREYDIFIESEHPFYTQDVLDNKAIAKSSHRIDLVFQHNWNCHGMTYYVEAKNLLEYDCRKTG